MTTLAMPTHDIDMLSSANFAVWTTVVHTNVIQTSIIPWWLPIFGEQLELGLLGSLNFHFTTVV